MNNAESTRVRKERLAIIQPMVTSGMKPAQIADATGINAETIRHFIRRWCVRPEGYVRPSQNIGCLMDWDSECDTSALTDEQREHAKRVGMTEGRYAWLLTCPKGMHHSLQKNQDNG